MTTPSRRIRPVYKKGRVNRAAEAIRNAQQTADDVAVVENWRASHNYVLNTFQANLRRRCRHNNDVVFAQRLKRRTTIYDKLSRQPKMQLARMHDIAGCRLIFRSLNEMYGFRDDFINNTKAKHTRITAGNDRYDYIANPKDTGYRGVHDVYKYVATEKTRESWSGLLIEIQYRTIYQHAWATAVEVADNITLNRAKFDEADVLTRDFFRITSEIIARVWEESSSCLAELTDGELLDLYFDIEEKTRLRQTLSQLPAINENVPEAKAVILLFDREEGNLTIFPFNSGPAAVEKYFTLEESSDEETDVVLVRADSGESVRTAFRNYFADAEDFVSFVDRGISELIERV